MDSCGEKKELIKYFKTLGLTVNTSTKARGHQGFFLKDRIDISKNIPDNRVVPTLLHEFAHYQHYCIEPEMNINGGHLSAVFGENNQKFEEELLKVTYFVDSNSQCVKLYEHKDRLKNYIKEQEEIIRQEYPDFMRSKQFDEFERYIKKSEARYLLRYDRVRIVMGGWFNKGEKLLSVNSLEQDFPGMPKSFVAYIRLRSAQKKQSKVSARINKAQKYYAKPTELFARFIEGLYLNKDWVCALAPYTSAIFYERLRKGFFPNFEPIADKYLR